MCVLRSAALLRAYSRPRAKEASEMYPLDPTEMLREAEERRLAGRLRARSPRRSPLTESRRPGAGFRWAVASLGGMSIPFFRV